MIDWKVLNSNTRVDEDVVRKIKICESCEFLGQNKNCTISECKCFVTSIAIEGLDCPIHKW